MKKALTIALVFVFLVVALSLANILQDTELTAKEFFSKEREFSFDETLPAVLPPQSSDESIWYFGDDWYILKGSEITKQNNATGEREIIYSDTETLDLVYLEPRMAYIKKGHTIYRLYIPTKELTEAFTDEHLEELYPISNNRITVHLTNPRWIEYLEKTGDYGNEPGIPGVNIYEVNLLTGDRVEVLGYRGEEITE